MKRNMKKAITIYAVILLAVLSNVHAQSIDKSVLKNIDAMLVDSFPQDQPGVTVLVAKDGEILYDRAFGLADAELKVPMNSGNIFRIGSITKQFTAVAILQLVSKGEIAIEDDITKYLKDYPTHGHSITIEHLLTHTSGIKSYTSMSDFMSNQIKTDMTPEELVDVFDNEPMDFAPGDQFRYNNSGYVLLGYIIEKVSGMSYEKYIEENIFKPLGLDNSYYGSASRIIENRARGYEKNGDTLLNADYLSMTLPYAAGSLLSTTHDLSRWTEAVMNGEVVDKALLEKAHTSFILDNGSETNYGYGWSLRSILGSPTIEHDGGINGFLTSGIYLPEEKVYVAVLSNCTCHDPGRYSEKIAALVLGKDFEREIMQVDSMLLPQYQAVYESKSGEQRIITVEGSNVYSVRTGGQRLEVFPFDVDKFFFKESFTYLEFKRDEDDYINSVVSQGRSRPIEWVRTDKPIPVKEAVKVSVEILKEYVGEYQLMPEFIMTVTLEGEQLKAQATGQPMFDVFAESETKFFLKVVDAQIEFVRNSEGKVDKLILYQAGQKFEGERVK
jgi:CubicO group peptidase (beta-lactamase class C family)